MKKALLGFTKNLVIAAVCVATLFGALWISAEYTVLGSEIKNDIQCALHEGEAVNYITVEEDTNGDGVMETSYVYYED